MLKHRYVWLCVPSRAGSHAAVACGCFMPELSLHAARRCVLDVVGETGA